MKSAHDLVVEAKQTVQEISVDQAISWGIDVWMAAGYEVFKPAQPTFE